ncbi:MAG: peptidylprolyl isomerase [Gammaproteobacteria bacterium]|nr:peptidylprolyl isomerase [Gammaproteobacteria bacterium]
MKPLALFGAMTLGALLFIAGAGSAWWLGSKRTDDATAPSAAKQESAVRTSAALARADLEQLLKLIDLRQRGAVLDSAEAFAAFVQQEAANQSVVRAAVANGAERNPLVAELMERAGLRVLAEVYLNQVVQANLASDFPNETQMREFFDANPERFRTPDRVHLWQIFLPVAETAAPAEIAAAERTANEVALALKQGKTDFAKEAARHSGHLQSRLSDGYMGLLQVDDLLPEIRAEVEQLAENAVSKPVRSATGFHVIKRGAKVQGQALKLDDVSDQIRRLLRQQGEASVRKAAVEQIIAKFPTDYDKTALEGWREALRTAAQPPGAAEAKP